MFLYFLLHITSLWADFLLILHGISLFTWARGADSSSQVKKIRVFAVLHWKLFFNWRNPNNLCLSDISWRHLELTWRPLNLWKGEPLSCSSNSQKGFFLTTLVFQTEPDWHLQLRGCFNARYVWAPAEKGDCTSSSQICMAVQ